MLIVALLGVGLLCVHGGGHYFDQIGLRELETRLAPAAVPNGAGVGVAQVELKIGDNYLPQAGTGTFTISSGVFAGKTFTAQSPGGAAASGHATTVARYFFGNDTDPLAGPASMAPGVTSIDSFGNLHYLGGAFVNARDKKVHSHAWIDVATSNTSLLAIDEEIDTYGVFLVNGLANAPGPVPALLASAYNTLSVGLSSGVHSSGFTGPGVAGEGRVKPEVVAPYSAGSWAVGGVSSMAVVLFDVASASPALLEAYEETEVMKAIIMAGATKEEFPGWSHSDLVPLDTTYGAGEVNIDNSHRILTAGKQSAGAAIGTRGWDFGSVPDTDADQDYLFTIPAGSMGDQVCVVLNWNRSGAAGIFHNLTLQLLDAAETTEWEASRSVVDNVEHLYYRNLPEGDYILRVTRGGDSGAITAYALAWRMELGTGPVVEVETGAGPGVINMSRLDPLVSYILERSANGNTWTPVVEFTPSGTIHAFLDFAGGSAYQYRLDWDPHNNGTPPDDPAGETGGGDPGGGDPGSGSGGAVPCGGPGIPCPSVTVIPSDGLELEITGLAAGIPCTIERSVDLVGWVGIENFTPGGSTFTYRESASRTAPVYYRLSSEAMSPGSPEPNIRVIPPLGTTLNFGDLVPGQDYLLERSTDLGTWKTVHQFTAPSESFDWLHRY
ncbi:MAG: hypothetical protein ACC661_02675, partial [Verrucomicrobiales bacterium]